MKNLLTFHIIPFVLCFWYLSAYVLQPFPSGLIAALILGLITYNSYRKPAHGIVAAVFLTPLTLSLGRHFNEFFGEAAPPYLPYAEIILVTTLWGLSWRMLLNRFNSERFPIIKKERSPIENLVLWLFGLWAGLSVIGIFPALIRNLQTSPAIPLELFVIKIGFAPVWGLGDEFFPITMAIRTVLAFFFVYYVQRLIRQEEWHPTVLRCFIVSMFIVAIYGLIQFSFEVGYIKGSFSRYLQSTFHENESFASFNFLAFVIAFPLFFLSKELWTKIFYGVASLFFLLAIFLSNSRAVMLLVMLSLLAYPVITMLYDRAFFRRKKKELTFAILVIPIVISTIAFAPTKMFERSLRLANDFFLLQDYDMSQTKALDVKDKKEAREKGGSLTLVARTKLWHSAGLMFADSKGAGMGTGSYYRLTGFPRYQAIYKMENAHFFWLQLLAEYGILIAPIILLGLLIPFWLVLSTNPNLYQRELAIALFAFWFCNIVGQSLMQQEIQWYFAILMGITAVGTLPAWFSKLSFFSVSHKSIVIILMVLLLGQATAWSIVGIPVQELGLSEIEKSETYGHSFDKMGHRYLQVGSMVQEDHYVPFEDAVLEFRVRAPESNASEEDPLRIKALCLDDYNRIISSSYIDLTGNEGIESLILPIPNMKNHTVTTVLTTNRVQLSGNILKSDERRKIGFNYYGCRWKETSNQESITNGNEENS